MLCVYAEEQAIADALLAKYIADAKMDTVNPFESTFIPIPFYR